MYLLPNLFPKKSSSPITIMKGEKTIRLIDKLAMCLEKETKLLTESSMESKKLQSLPVIEISSVI